jgi:hypothetical protein
VSKYICNSNGERVAQYLIGIEVDPKSTKGSDEGYLTAVQYFAPNKISGFNVCVDATIGCIKACLFTAGKGRFSMVQEARIRRTLFFFKERDAYFAQLIKEILALIRKAKRRNMTPAVRLNGTSDLPWERIAFTYQGVRYANIMQLFPLLQFYDYTATGARLLGELPDNYDLTFSYKETEANHGMADLLLRMGKRVAAVFNVKAGYVKGTHIHKHTLPTTYAIGNDTYTVTNGDVNDLRFLDPQGVIVGLRAKGDARKDKSGFVLQVA